MRISNVFALILLLLYSHTVLSADSTIFVDFVDNAYEFWEITPAEPDNPPRRVSRERATPLSPPVSDLLRNGMRFTPGGALRDAATTLVTLTVADYIWDDLMDWFTRELNPAPPQSSCDIAMYSQHNVSSPQASEYISACGELGGTVFYPNSSGDYMGCLDGIIPMRLNNGLVFDAAQEQTLIVQQQCRDDIADAENNVQRAPLPDADFGDIITSNAPEDIGLPLIRNVPQDILRDIINVPAPSSGGQTDPDTATRRSSPITPSSSTTSPSVTTYDPTTGAPTARTEWPAFCDWAMVVCEFIYWYTDPAEEPDKEEIPTQEIGGEIEQYDSGLGQGSCPDGFSFDLAGETIFYSYAPACNAMIWFKPFLIGMCSLIAVYIIVGHKQA